MLQVPHHSIISFRSFIPLPDQHYIHATFSRAIDPIMSNNAAWITGAKEKPLQVKEAPLPKAGPGEVVIQNHAVAINPVDCRKPRP